MPNVAFCKGPGFLDLIHLRRTFMVYYVVPCSRLRWNNFVGPWFQEVTCVHIHCEHALSTSRLETEDAIRDCDARGCVGITF